MKVYEFIYSECTWESAAASVSIHKTRKGAEMALEFHKEEKHKEYLEIWDTPEQRKEFPFGNNEYWGIRETEIQD